MRRREKNGLGGAGRASAVGIELAVAVVGGLLLGWWLDDLLGWAPWLTLVGLVFGTAIGFRGLFKAAKESAERDD